jgi:hypothetical protein
MMKTLLESSMKIEKGSKAGVAVGLLLLMLILAGCESPSGTPGTRPGAGSPGRSSAAQVPGRSAKPFAPGGARTASASNPILPASSQALNNPANPLVKPGEQKKAEALPEGVNPLAPTAKVEQAGNTVELASAIIVAKANPFLDWLPKPLQTVEVPTLPGEPASVSIPADPFATVTLLGVIYHPKSPMALLGGGEQTQLLGKGGVFNLAATQAEVTAIRADGVDLQLLDGSKQTRTFLLPDIVGYQSTTSSSTGKSSPDGNSGGSSSKTRSSGTNPPASQSAAMGMGAMGNGTMSSPSVSGLGNLQKLSQQPLQPADKSSARGAQPNLQEL